MRYSEKNIYLSACRPSFRAGPTGMVQASAKKASSRLPRILESFMSAEKTLSSDGRDGKGMPYR